MAMRDDDMIYDPWRNERVTPAPTAPAPAPREQFGGFNANNVFDSWDLNPLSQRTGVGRDDLATQRDAFLQPMFQRYRTQAKQLGGRGDEGDQQLFGSSDFQNFARTGQMPKFATPAQQWNAQPAQPSQTTQRSDDLFSLLMERAKQGTAVDRNDPNVRSQVDPATAQMERSSRQYLDEVAERSGPLANIQGERRLAAERTGQAAGQLESEVIGRLMGDRRDEIMQSMALGANWLSGDRRMELERELAALSDRARTEDRNLHNDQFLRELSLREFDLNNTWDYNWMVGR